VERYLSRFMGVLVGLEGDNRQSGDLYLLCVGWIEFF